MARVISGSCFYQAAAVFAVMALLFCTNPARADITSTTNTPRVLQQALAMRDHVNLYGKSDGKEGLNISGGFFSGRASGVDPVASNYLADEASHDFSIDRTAELEGDQRVYALLIDGSYDFNYDLGTGLPIHPYMTSGVGMAMYDHTTGPSASTLALQNGSMAPLFRVGGGVTYHLGKQWDMSLDYKAGFSGGGDQVFTGRSQQSVDLQVLNMGMHYQF